MISSTGRFFWISRMPKLIDWLSINTSYDEFQSNSLSLPPNVFISGNPPNNAEKNSYQSSGDLFFLFLKRESLSLNTKVLNRSNPGDLIKLIPGSRFGYGGPEIISTLWPSACNAFDSSYINMPWPPPNGALR